MISASMPMPAMTTNTCSRAAPSTRSVPTSIRAVRPVSATSMASSMLPMLSSSARARRLPVPAGSSPSGTSVPASTSATARTVPSPPSAHTRSAPFSSASRVWPPPGSSSVVSIQSGRG